MCELAKRSWSHLVEPARIAVGLGSLGSFAAGIFVEGPLGLVFIAVGAALLLIAVISPAIREIELGFPTGVKVTAGARDRVEDLRREFEAERKELELCAGLLCADPAQASQLLEAAWARAVQVWRGPITPGLRIFVLCTFVHLLTAQTRWVVRQQPASGAAPTPTGPLSRLSAQERVVVVLIDFAMLPVDEVARIAGISVTDVQTTLDSARAGVEHSDRRS